MRALEPAGARFDGVVARAFRGPAEFLRLAAAISTQRAAIVLMAGPIGDDELGNAQTEAGDLTTLREVRRFQLPAGSEARVVARFERLP